MPPHPAEDADISEESLDGWAGRLPLQVWTARPDGQLDWGLRNDPRVVVIERANARALEPAHLPSLVDIVTIDVSFISLRHILPVVPSLLARDGDVIALVKPQFEAGKGQVGRGGVVRDHAVRVRAVLRVIDCLDAVGLGARGLIRSPIEGRDGNVEYLLWLRKGEQGLALEVPA